MKLKFRAYNTKEKKFVDCNPTRTFETMVHIGVGSDENIEIIPLEDLVLQQFTGLKDKNGKEIYVGDIVRYDDGDNLEVGREEVKFNSGAFSCSCYSEEYGFTHERRTIEVIGNIYEN